jgi:hypothetical protein
MYLIQTLESTPIVCPEGWFVYNIIFTEAGRAKVQREWEYLEATSWQFIGRSWEGCVDDIECDAISMEMEPACRFGKDEIRFIRDVDFVVEMRSFEADRMARIAAIVEETHKTMEKEMDRLGW